MYRWFVRQHFSKVERQLTFAYLGLSIFDSPCHKETLQSNSSQPQGKQDVGELCRVTGSRRRGKRKHVVFVSRMSTRWSPGSRDFRGRPGIEANNYLSF